MIAISYSLLYLYYVMYSRFFTKCIKDHLTGKHRTIQWKVDVFSFEKTKERENET